MMYFLLIQWGIALASLMFVIPQFKEIFMGMKVHLPLPTQIILMMSDFLVAWWFAVLPLAMVGFVVGITMVPNTEQKGSSGSDNSNDGLVILNVATFIILVLGVYAVFRPMLFLVSP